MERSHDEAWVGRWGELSARLERALAGRAVESVWPASRALVGFEAAIASSGEARERARGAVDKLRAGGRLLPAECELLEEVLRRARPAVRLEAGRLPGPGALGVDDAVRGALDAQLPGVASLGWRWGIPLATAFQLAPRVLVTNAHVADKLEHEHADLARGDFVACFERAGPDGVRTATLTGVLARHPSEDVALVGIDGDGPLVRGLRLASEPGVAASTRVLGVGYPLYGDGQPEWVDALFENVYGVKRASPGELLGGEGERLFHDCTTLSGSSGSPLFDVRTGRVIGIHATGRFAWRNTAVSVRALRGLASAWAPDALWE